MNQLYMAKETGVTEQGSRYAILQDTPVSFHITVSRENNVIYDYMERPQSKDHIMNNIQLLEKELIEKFNLTPTEQ